MHQTHIKLFALILFSVNIQKTKYMRQLSDTNARSFQTILVNDNLAYRMNNFGSNAWNYPHFVALQMPHRKRTDLIQPT